MLPLGWSRLFLPRFNALDASWSVMDCISGCTGAGTNVLRPQRCAYTFVGIRNEYYLKLVVTTRFLLCHCLVRDTDRGKGLASDALASIHALSQIL